MIISYGFLKTILKDSCPTASELKHQLTQIGFEVDSIDSPILQKAIVVNVIAVKEFTFEEKKLFNVDIAWKDQNAKVVTSWAGLRPGNKVVYASPGQEINQKTLLRKEFNDHISEGMLLSWQELKLNSDWLSSAEKEGLLTLPDDTPEGFDFYELFFLDEPFFHLKVPYNRPDCLSFYGLLREITTAFGIPLPVQSRKDIRVLLPTFNEKQIHRTVSHSRFKGIEVMNPEKCPFYAGVIIENVRIGPSCYEMRKALFAFQLKPILNAVDAVNVLMMYFGHPLHTFDLDKVEGKHILVRSSKSGESIETLDSSVISLDDNDLVIADEIRPIALAGVMGGKETEVTQHTRNIFIESAYFDPVSISYTSEKHRLHTDASGRFSRGADIMMVKEMLVSSSHMISYLCNGMIAGENCFVGSNEFLQRVIPYSLSDFSKVTGLDISKYSATHILQLLEIPFEIKLHDQLMIKVPSFRMIDIKESVDITEELLRFVGYDKIVSKRPCFNVCHTLDNPRVKTERWLKNLLRGWGHDEIITDSFISDEVLSLVYKLDNETLIKVSNPLRSGWQFLNPEKLLNMMSVIKNNFSRKITNLRLFEIGKNYLNLSEELYLNIVLTGSGEKNHWSQNDDKYDFYDVKGRLEAIFSHLGIDVEQKKNVQLPLFDSEQSVDYYFEKHLIASAGLIRKTITDYFDVSQNVFFGKIKLAPLVKYYQKEKRYQPFSYMQEINRDICVYVPNHIKAGDMIHRIKEVAGTSLKHISVFDLYEPIPAESSGRKSIAFRLSFIFNSNVSKEKIQEIINSIVNELTLSFGAELRK